MSFFARIAHDLFPIPLRRFFVMLLLLEAGRRFKARPGLEASATIENADFALVMRRNNSISPRTGRVNRRMPFQRCRAPSHIFR
jgi:hypothetical protein